MPKVTIYNQQGATKGELELNEVVFGCPYNEALIHQVIVAQRANARQGTKSTLTRSEVRGGGIKPWRQKGTGRARQGSIRSPQWIKGGVVFAPKPRDFGKKVNKQAKYVALTSALSTLVTQERLVVVDQLTVEGKTREMAQIMRALKIDKSALILLTEGDELVVRAARNLELVKTLPANLVNVLDIVSADKCIATVAAIKKIEEAYGA